MHMQRRFFHGEKSIVSRGLQMKNIEVQTISIADAENHYVTPYDSDGAVNDYQMDLWNNDIKNGLVPVDPLTGIPLHIAPIDKPSWVRHSRDYYDNHHIYHFSTDPSLKGMGGEVVRHSRMQRGPRWAHEILHNKFRKGVAELPKTDDRKFFVGVCACNDMIPPYAINLSSKAPTIIKLGKKALRDLQSGFRVFPEKKIDKYTGEDHYLSERGQFFMQQAMDMGFDKIDISLLERYVYETDQDLRRHLGMMVISAYLDKATKPISLAYQSSIQMGLIPENHPSTPVEFIKHVSLASDVSCHSDYFSAITTRAKKRLSLD